MGSDLCGRIKVLFDLVWRCGFGLDLYPALNDDGRAMLARQFRLAMEVPGKEEFAETLRYYSRRLEVLDVDVRLSTRPTVEEGDQC